MCTQTRQVLHTIDAGGILAKPHRVTLDRVFAPESTQPEIYAECAETTVAEVLQGFNGTIFAYGQTGSGKSYTMFGPRGEDRGEEGETRGIIPRATREIFRMIQEDAGSGNAYSIACSFLEIYQERVVDLLNPSIQSRSKEGLRVRETPARGVWVEGLTSHIASTPEEIEALLEIGESNRTTACTAMNAESSRSHSIFSIQVLCRAPNGSSKSGKLSLVDLAGSEKVSRTGATGDRMDEAKNINKSLTSLGRCIFSLTQPGTSHVPYRDSKLTFILKDSLGGNAKTTLIVACSPSLLDAEETLSTLRFAQRAKEIQNV